MSGDPRFPRQSRESLPSGIQFRTDGAERLWKLFGRGGSSVPASGLTPRVVLANEKAPGLLIRCRLTQTSSTNTGQGVNARVIAISRDGSTTRARVHWDSADESEYQAGWHKTKHEDIRTVTWIVQLDEEKTRAATHLVVIFMTRGSGGAVSIYPGPQIRNHYQRIRKGKLGAAELTTFFPRYSTQSWASAFGVQMYERAFDPIALDIAKGQRVRLNMSMFVNLATCIEQGSIQRFLRFSLGFVVRFRRRDGSLDTAGAVFSNMFSESNPILTDELLSKSETFIALAPYTQCQVYFYFMPRRVDRSGTVSFKLNQDSIVWELTFDESAESGST